MIEENRRVYKFEGEAGEDFHIWSARTEAALEAKELMSVVTEDIIGDGTADLSAEVKRSISKARALIIQGLGEKPLRICLPEKHNPHKMWIMLKDRYAVANIATRLQLQTRISRMAYRSQLISELVNDFESLFNKLAGVGSAVSEDMQIYHFLAAFGDKNRSPFGHAV